MTRIVTRTPRWDAADVALLDVCMTLARRRLHLRYFGGMVYDANPYKILPPQDVGGRHRGER